MGYNATNISILVSTSVGLAVVLGITIAAAVIFVSPAKVTSFILPGTFATLFLLVTPALIFSTTMNGVLKETLGVLSAGGPIACNAPAPTTRSKSVLSPGFITGAVIAAVIFSLVLWACVVLFLKRTPTPAMQLRIVTSALLVIVIPALLVSAVANADLQDQIQQWLAQPCRVT